MSNGVLGKAVLVTEEGIEILAYYPRDLASLIIPA